MIDFLSPEKYSLLSKYKFFKGFEIGEYKDINLFLSNLDAFKSELIDKGFDISDIENLKLWAKQLYLSKAEKIRRNKISIFLRICYAIEEYNSAHDMGASIFGAIFSNIPGNEQLFRERNERLQKIISYAHEQSKLSRVIGLSFDFDFNRSLTMFGPGMGEGQHSRELRVNIDDAKKFIDFLKGLDVADFSEYSALKSGLIMVIKVLTRQVGAYYGLEKPDNRAIELLGHAKLIVEELERLGLSSDLVVLKQYVEHSHHKRLREFLALSDKQCFEPVNSHRFGPSEWHTDTSIEHYEHRWQRTYDAVSFALKNGNALPLVREAVNNLIACGLSATRAMKPGDKRIEIAKNYIRAYQKIKTKTFK